MWGWIVAFVVLSILSGLCIGLPFSWWLNRGPRTSRAAARRLAHLGGSERGLEHIRRRRLVKG